MSVMKTRLFAISGFKTNVKQSGAIVVELAIAMIIMAAIVSFAIPLVKDISSEAIDEQADKISKHYP